MSARASGGDAGWRLVRVAVRAFGHEALDVGEVAADGGDDAGDRGDRGHHLQAAVARGGGPVLTAAARGRQGDGGCAARQAPTIPDSGWRRGRAGRDVLWTIVRPIRNWTQPPGSHRPVGPETPHPPVGVARRRGGGGGGRLAPLHDELGDAVAPLDQVVLVGVGVDQQHPQLVAVAAVDQARRVEAGDAVAQGQAAAGLHEPGVALGHGEGDAGGHERPPAAPAQASPPRGPRGRRRRRRDGRRPAAAGRGRGRTTGICSTRHHRRTARRSAPVGPPDSLPTCSCGWTSR